jgi:hypothetical protein
MAILRDPVRSRTLKAWEQSQAFFLLATQVRVRYRAAQFFGSQLRRSPIQTFQSLEIGTEDADSIFVRFPLKNQ